MYRERKRACPGCASPMTEVALPEGRHHSVAEIDLCHSCGGVWFEFFDGEPANLSRRALNRGADTAGQKGGASRAKAGVLTCPDCRRGMQRSTYLDLPEGPRIGRCEACFSVFVPRRELRALARFRYDDREVERARTTHRRLSPSAVEVDVDDELPPVKDVVDEAERFFRSIRAIDRVGHPLWSLIKSLFGDPGAR